jgi:DNA end-binding protein Ku
MARAIWSGAISFGLVNVPVRMFSGINEHTLHFHYLHTKDDSPIGYEKVCKKERKQVPANEIVKAFEYEKGEYVYMTDDDFETAKADTYRSIDIRDFVPYEEIDPIYFRHTYFLGPDKGAERVYAMLRDAMAESGLAAIAKFVMRDRQNLGCLRVRENVITLEQMYFADEVRSVDEIAPRNVKVDRRELEMALQLIDSFTSSFEPSKYDDTHRDTLCEIIRAKRKGKAVHHVEPEEPVQPSDLMEALRQSLEATRRRGSGADRDRGAAKTPRGRAASSLRKLGKSELYDLAKKADIPGRADMTKDQLVHALQRVGG